METKVIYGPCYSNPCQNGAKCIPGNIGAGEIRYSCICEHGFMGNNCETGNENKIEGFYQNFSFFTIPFHIWDFLALVVRCFLITFDNNGK